MPKKQWNKSVASQWGLFLPPARPSLSELAFLEQELIKLRKKNKQLKVAILGSTPEYRDLCQTLNIHYRCIDYSAGNFETLTQFMLHKDDAPHLLLGDWRNMQFREKFDVFMGDLFTCVTPVEDHELLYSSIKQHSRRGAYVFIKVPLRGNNQQLTHQQIFSFYRKRLSHLNPFAAVWREVLLADYDFKEDTMSCQMSLERLRQSFSKRIITRYEFEEFRKRWLALGDFKMNVPLRSEFLKKAQKYFQLKKVHASGDWYGRHIPIVVCRAV